MIPAGKLDVSGAVDMPCQIASFFRFHPAVARRLRDQRRNVDGGQDVANIDFRAQRQSAIASVGEAEFLR